MRKAAYRPEWHRAIVTMSAAVVTAILVGGLYWARSILIPLALAVFLTFVLAPVVRYLERRRVGRVPAVLATVGLTLMVGAATFWVIGTQITGLAQQLPESTDKITKKAERVRGWFNSANDPRFEEFSRRVQQAVFPRDEKPDPQKTVVVSQPSDGWQSYASAVFGPAAEVLGQAAFALILTVFMLLKREDLRNRMLRLAGSGQVTTSTKAMDDASRRVSRYLLMQLLINTGFGLVVTAVLFACGIPFAPLWGFLGTLMRYVPYIGTWIGLIPPLLFTLAMSDDFAQPLIVVGVFLGLEALCNNVFEPWLYGHSLGISEVAQLVAAAFWAFLWGPIGLILSGPLTTCLLVLGKYNPRFEFLDVLLGDTPPLAPSVAYFQRLTARDQDEAERVARSSVDSADPAKVMDEVIFPALRLTSTAADRGELADEEERFILGATREIIDDLTESLAPRGEVVPIDGDRVRLLACPARDDADRVALEGLARVLPADKWEVEVTSVETLSSEVGTIVERFQPAVVCVCSLPPGGVSHTRYLCKRLRNRFPDLKIVVARWAVRDDDDALDAKTLGADAVYPTLAAAREELTALHAVLRSITDAEDGKPSGLRAAIGTGAAKR